jgi:hypothetical protein
MYFDYTDVAVASAWLIAISTTDQPGRRREPCQLKTSWQTLQQLRLHFAAVKAFAFACPRVPGRGGPFLGPQFLFIGKRSKTAAVSLIVVEQILGSLIRGIRGIARGCREIALRRTKFDQIALSADAMLPWSN